MSYATPFCPTCGSALALNRQGEFNPWVCPNGHGIAATLSEAYAKAQEDELDELWKLAKDASPGSRTCPMCEQAMVVVDLPWDGDEAFEGTPGDGPDEGHELLDVCARDQLIWFDAGELDALPADLPDPEPTAEELTHVAEITRTFGEQLHAAAAARVDHTVSEKVYKRMSRHPGVIRFLGGRAKADS